MNPEQKQFLSLERRPARLTTEQAAWLLGFNAHDIPILVSAGLLTPLGNVPVNGVKYFSAAGLQELETDGKWLTRATNAIYKHWRTKNARANPRPTAVADARRTPSAVSNP